MDNLDSVLQSVKQLYTKISRRLFVQKVKSYHPGLGDVGATMQQLIDDLVTDVTSLSEANYKSASDILHTNATSVTTGTIKSPDTPARLSASAPFCEVPPDLDSLATEFKSEKRPSMQSNLMQSTWDHVHTAHRHAREGDRDKALFQIRLASDALDTLRHYMASKEYEDFVSLIYQQLGMKTNHY